VGRVTACGAAALFVVSLTHWTQAVIPEVYGLNTVFIALQLLLLVRLAAAPSGRRLLLLAGVTGLSATNHTTEIPVATIVAVLERTAQACDGYPLVHATDNGPPYVSHEVAELHARERVIPLRNRLHTPTDNARAERGSGELHGTGSTTSCRAPRSVGGQRRRLTACCRGGTLWWTGRSSMPLRAPPSLPPCSAAARRVHDARRNARRSPRPWSDSNSSEEPEAVRLSTPRNAKVFREQHGFGWQ